MMSQRKKCLNFYFETTFCSKEEKKFAKFFNLILKNYFDVSERFSEFGATLIAFP